MPDIVFRPREPGLGTQQSVEAAVKTVLARGIVDPARVGHVGHSQGGYEAAFLGTHSKLFATTVVGSGITDMISFAGQLHWSGGIAEFDHWETGQFRMEVAPWEDMKAMIDNSPLATVRQDAGEGDAARGRRRTTARSIRARDHSSITMLAAPERTS